MLQLFLLHRLQCFQNFLLLPNLWHCYVRLRIVTLFNKRNRGPDLIDQLR